MEIHPIFVDIFQSWLKWWSERWIHIAIPRAEHIELKPVCSNMLKSHAVTLNNSLAVLQPTFFFLLFYFVTHLMWFPR